MSRIPKYRVWDRQEKKMRPVPSLSFGDDGSALTVTIWLEKERRLLVVGENCDLMQFTGLKDKSGREIFEGDIIKTQNTPDYRGDDDPYYGQVQCKDQGAMFVIVQTHTTYTPSLSNLLIESREIIGNIYENPYLMTAHEAQA